MIALEDRNSMSCEGNHLSRTRKSLSLSAGV